MLKSAKPSVKCELVDQLEEQVGRSVPPSYAAAPRIRSFDVRSKPGTAAYLCPWPCTLIELFAMHTGRTT